MENMEIGFVLLLVGMSTVFTILAIIIYLGEKMILVINRFSPEDSETTAGSKAGKTETRNIDPRTVAAITAAVNVVTEGKGKISEIRK